MTSNCPKFMSFGPCGGVRLDGGCEVDGHVCPFVNEQPIAWSGRRHTPRPVELPPVIVDHRSTGRPADDDRILTRYRDRGVGVLLGDHLDDPAEVDRAAVARRTAASGVATIATVAARNRSTSEVERLVADYVSGGVRAVLCVTGDHPSARDGHRGPATFSTEGTLLAQVARERGAVVAVAESPAARPTGVRVARLRTKQDAGADVAILNHTGTVAAMLEFAEVALEAGVGLHLVAPVPVMTDRESIEALTQFPGVVIEPRDQARVLRSADPVGEGVALAVESAHRLLASGLVAGVNLSGRATSKGPVERSRIMGRVADDVIGGATGGSTARGSTGSAIERIGQHPGG